MSFNASRTVLTRLQLVATNSFKYTEQIEDQTSDSYEAAEKAALQLWNALDGFRTSFDKGKKRKHAEDGDTSTTALWERMEFHEKRQNARRKQVLEKVCAKRCVSLDIMC